MNMFFGSKTPRRTALLGAVALLAASCAPQAPPQADFSAVHTAIAQAIASNQVTGATVLVRHGNAVVYRDAQGAVDGQALAPDTVFWAASMTKPIVATTVMMMVEAGAVHLDDPVSKYIPQFARPQMVRTLVPGQVLPPMGPPAPGAARPHLLFTYAPATRPLTVRDIITMTGGLQTIRLPPAVPPVAPDDTVASYTAKLGGATLDFQPGSRWGYSNATEFEVAVRIVEVASGMGYAHFVQTRLFDPLGMKDSSFGVRADLAARTLPLGMIALNPISKGRFTSGSAGLWTTTEDYSRFAQMLLDGGAANGQHFLRAETVAMMSSNQIGGLSLGGLPPDLYGGLPATTNPAVKYGYGLMVLEDPAGAGTAVPAGSFGWDGVGTRRTWIMPKIDTVLVMVAPGPQSDAAQRTIERAVVGPFGG